MGKFLTDDEVSQLEAAPAPKKFISDEEMAAIEESGKPSMSESALRGGAQGLSFGFADELSGGVNAAYDAAKKMSVSDIVKDYISRRDEYRAADRAAEEANPVTYGTSQIGGGLATALVPGLGWVKGGSALANGARVLGTGAINGLGLSEADNPGEMALDTAKGAGYAAAGGIAGNLASRAIPNAVSAGKYATKKAVEHLRPTPKVARVLGPERLAEVGRHALDSGTIKAGANAGETAERLAVQRGEIGKEIGQFIDDAGAKGVRIDPAQVAAKFDSEVIKPLRGQAANRGIVEKLEKQKADFLDHYSNPDPTFQGPKPLLTPQQLEEEKRAVQGGINYLTDPKAAQEAQMGYASTLKEVSEGAINNPGFEKAKSDFGKTAEAQAMAERTSGLTDSGTGLLGHLHDMNASQIAMGVALNGEPVSGALIAGTRAATRGRVNSTLAVGADKVSKFLNAHPYINKAAEGLSSTIREAGPIAARQNGEYTKSNKLDAQTIIGKLQNGPARKFSGAIENAAARGDESLATTHFILSQTEPEYQKAVQE